MQSITEISEQIKACLVQIKPDKIILFGSYAYGNPGEGSDIDLLVVTNENQVPIDYKQTMDSYINVSTLLSDLKKKYPFDLIVYSRPMYASFINSGSMFAKEIIQNGKIIYESNNRSMA